MRIHHSINRGNRCGIPVRWSIIIFLFGPLGGLLQAAPLSIAIIDHQDIYTNTKGLGACLTDLGQTYTDLTDGLLAGGAVDLTGFNTFIIGSHAAANTVIQSALKTAEAVMWSFVEQGGTIIMLTQADQNRADETWMERPAQAHRCDLDFGTVYRIRTAHSLFNRPNTINDADLSGWSYNSWPGSWESFDLFRGMGVLAGNHATAPTYGTILEAGWGSGRALLLAMAPDKARNIGNAQAIAQAPRLLSNLLVYAQDVQGGLLPPVVLYENPLAIAIVEFQDTWTNTKGLGQSLADMGYGYTDLTPALLAGGAINLTGYNTFIIGSHVVQNTTLQTALTNAKTTLNSFVNRGGAVIMMTQADQYRANEDWLATPANVVRCDTDFDAVFRIQNNHQLFQQPNVITDSHLTGWQYLGSQTWPTSWESFNTFQNVGALAGNRASDPTLATLLESGWGYGRAVLTSLAPDKARNIGNAQAKTQAPRLVQNLMRYAADVQNGRVKNVVINSGGYVEPIQGVVYHDLDGDGMRDAGEPGLAGVGVSDSVDLVLTGTDGRYRLPNSGSNATLIYISIPSGYSKSFDWYRHIHAASSGSVFDFALRAGDESGPFDFVQVTDIHIGGSGGKNLYIEALAQINQLAHRPALIVATGDLVNTGTNTIQYTDYAAAIATSTVPVFNVFGNHDIGGTTGNYRAFLGPDYYSFSYGNCHFLVVNSVYQTSLQSNWIDTDLRQLRGSKKLFIFQHYYPTESEHNRFAAFPADAVFSGHWHSQHSVQVGSMRSYNSPNLLFGGIDCSPAGFKIVSVDGSTLSSRVRYRADGRWIRIVSPNDSVITPRLGMTVAVNAYDATGDFVTMSYVIKRNEQQVAAGNLARKGEWSWTGILADRALAAGPCSIFVTGTTDQGQTATSSADFTVWNRGRATPIPTGNWPQFGGGPSRGGKAVSTTLTSPLGISWMTHTEGTIDFASPILYQNSVYIGVKNRGDFTANGVLALNARDGGIRWFTSTPAAVSHSVAVNVSRVYACSHGGLLHVFDRDTGQQIHQRTLGSTVQRFLYGAPVVSDGRVFAGTYGYFASFDENTVTQQWSQVYGADWISSNASPATNGSIVIVPANWATNSIRGVSATDGLTAWEYAIQGLHGSPVISGSMVVFTSYDGQLVALNATTGALAWSVSIGGPSATTPAISGNTIIAGGTGSIRAHRLDNGQLLWDYPVPGSPLKMSPYNNTTAALIGSPTIVGDVAYVPTGSGRLYALGLATGDLRWSMDFGAPILSAPCISGNTLYLTTYDGHVYALTDSSGFGSPADLDSDGDVDAADLNNYLNCATGDRLGPLSAYCVVADLDADQDVDMDDFAILQRCLSGTNQPAAPDCAD